MIKTNIHYVNRSGANIDGFFAAFAEAYKNGGNLPEELADLFTVTFLKEYNPDGSDRMLIDAA